ncbi:EipB family protein [Kiloniella litopenaei]|nr:DUF1849 family protein [Kiloniella litopenaei]
MRKWQKKVFGLSASAAVMLFVQTGLAEQNTDDLLLHKAIYDLRLNSSHQGAINSMGGQITYDLTSDCRGWLMANDLEMSVIYSTGQRMDMDLKINTWESLDGEKYRFTVKQDGNLSGQSGYIGKSSRSNDDNSVLAKITEPEKQSIVMQDVIYPTAFLKEIIQAAKNGETALNKVVFDGTAELDAFQASAIVLPNEDKNIPSALRGKASWKVFLAFYEVGAKNTLPIQEQKLTLFENGVVTSIDLDFGDFSVKGSLVDFEVHSAPQCE